MTYIGTVKISTFAPDIANFARIRKRSWEAVNSQQENLEFEEEEWIGILISEAVMSGWSPTCWGVKCEVDHHVQEQDDDVLVGW